MIMKKILIIDRSDDYVTKVKRAFNNKNQIFSANRSHRALLRICQANPDVIIMGTNIGDINPLSFLKQIKYIAPASHVIITDRDFNTRTGKKYKKEKAFDYIRKSEYLDSLISSVENALELPISACYNDRIKILNEIIGTSSQAALIKLNILKFSSSDLPVLLLGESGTGKDLAAHCMHRLSNRFDKKYININCGAIPDNLIESELFGAEKGAFTDSKTIPGKFEQTNGGTLFLNEIGELPASSQVKLLNVLESKTVTRLGGQTERPVDTRIITATNINLKKAVKEKRFRQDLLYRINTLYFEIPPLRKRKEDIKIIVETFLNKDEHPSTFQLMLWKNLWSMTGLEI